MLKKYFMVLLVLCVCAAQTVECKRRKKRKQEAEAKVLCTTQESCANMQDKNCACYCSVKCGPRAKTDEDRPEFINGKCYCKQWDYDNYTANECDKKDQGSSGMQGSEQTMQGQTEFGSQDASYAPEQVIE